MTALEYIALAEACRARAMDGRPKLARDHLLGAAEEFARLAHQEMIKARARMRAPFGEDENPAMAPSSV